MKHSPTLPPYKRHRIVMAVHVPSQSGYFEGALKIFEMSLESLLATVDPAHVSITVVDNASIPEVSAIVAAASDAGRIDRHIRHQVNRGKPDAVAAEISASYEPFVTLVDADVLFLPGWLGAVESIFECWPGTGAVSPSGQSKTAFHQDSFTWIASTLSGQLRLGRFALEADLVQFAHSVGNETLYSPAELALQFAVVRGQVRALMGAGHFVITFRRSCFKGFDYKPRLEGTGHGMRAIDMQIDRSCRLRLSTTSAYVLHMGNTLEPWMQQRLDATMAVPPMPLSPAGLALDRERPRIRLPYFLVRWGAAPIVYVARAIHRLRGSRMERSSKAGRT